MIYQNSIRSIFSLYKNCLQHQPSFILLEMETDMDVEFQHLIVLYIQIEHDIQIKNLHSFQYHFVQYLYFSYKILHIIIYKKGSHKKKLHPASPPAPKM